MFVNINSVVLKHYFDESAQRGKTMTEELKKALENAHTEEEKKAVAEKYKLTIRELTDEELDLAAGGIPCPPDHYRYGNKCVSMC